MHWLIVSTVLLAGEGAAPPERTLRTYDIRFLTEAVPDFPAQLWPRAGDLRLRRPYEEDGAGELVISFGEDEDGDGVAPPGCGLSPELLVEVIRRNIAEDSWANERNSIRATEAGIWVVQTPEVHRAISRLLGELRDRRARMVTVDVALVPLDRVPGIAASRSPWISDREFEAALDEAKAAGTRLSLTAYNEQLVSTFSGVRWTQLVDAEINQTGVIPVANSVVEKRPLGISLELRPTRLARSGWYRVDLRLARLAKTGPAARNATFFGDFQIQPLREESLETVLLLEEGRAVFAGSLPMRLGGELRPAGVLARIRPLAVRAEPREAPPPEETFHLRAYDVAFLLEPLPGEEPLLDGDVLVDLIESGVDPEAWRDERAGLEIDGSGRLLHAVARQATHRKVGEFVDRHVRDRARLARLEVVELEGPLESIRRIRSRAAGSGQLPADWPELPESQGLEEVHRTVSLGVLGCRMKARAFRARRFFSDVDNVSGGTGFTVQMMPDPILESAGTGFELEASVRPALRAGFLAVDLELTRVQTRFERKAEILIATTVESAEAAGVARVVPGDEETPGGIVRPTLTAQIPFRIDLPRQEGLARHFQTVVPAGHPAILEVRSVGEGKGRLLVLTAEGLGTIEEGR